VKDRSAVGFHDLEPVLGTIEAAYRYLAAPFLGVRPFCPKLIQLSNWDFLRQPLFIDVIAAARAMS
jgi:hypothetical protein